MNTPSNRTGSDLTTDDECEIVTNHLVLDGPEIAEHIVTVCGRDAIAVIDDDGDDVTVCLTHLPAGATVVERLGASA